MSPLRLPASLALILLACVAYVSAQTAPTGADGWVVLPVSEYVALKRAAAPAEPLPTGQAARPRALA